MNGQLSNADHENSFFSLSHISSLKFVSALQQIETNIPIKDIIIAYTKPGENTPTSNYHIKEVSIDPENRMDLKIVPNTDTGDFLFRLIHITSQTSVAGFLFYPDFVYWHEIKNLTPGQYLLKQLEMFDFIQEPVK